MLQWDSHRRLKQEVIARHSDVLDTLLYGVPSLDIKSASKIGAHISNAAEKHTIATSSRMPYTSPDSLAQQLASSELESRDSGGNQNAARKINSSKLKDKNQVLNDYNQSYIDSGLRSLPGTWVRNVSPSTRFIE